MYRAFATHGSGSNAPSETLGVLFEKAAAETRMLDPEAAASDLTALGTHGQLDFPEAT